jgi:hypothetical protein
MQSTINFIVDVTKPSSVVLSDGVYEGRVNLSWTQSSDNSGIAGYNVYRCTKQEGCNTKEDFTLLTPNSLLLTTYTDTYPCPEYNCYAVAGLDYANNESDLSNILSIRVTEETAMDSVLYVHNDFLLE